MTKRYIPQRKDGPLPGAKARNFPKRLLFFDTETHIIEQDNEVIEFPFKLGYVIFVELNNECNIIDEQHYELRNEPDFIFILENLLRSGKTLYIYAHNIGFDIRVLNLPIRFNELGYESKPPIVNDRIFIWDVKRENYRMCFLDTANYNVWSVEQLGQDMGYPKLNVDFTTVPDNELMEYCKRDVEILQKFVVKFIQFIHNNELGAVKSTIASQALTTYRTRFMHNVPFIHTNEEALELERSGYYGGRVECFFIGKKTGDEYYYVDFNSMYPYVMKHAKVPTKFRGFSRQVELRYLELRLKRFYVIARVLLNTKHNDYPLRWHGRLIFPVGQFVTTLHQPELELAMKRGDIVECYQCAVYEKDVIFDSYIDYFYRLKEQYTIESNYSWRLISKYFLNTLYGKFGQLNIERIEHKLQPDNVVYTIPFYHEPTKKHGRLTHWFGTVYEETKEGNSLYAIPAIAGAITAAAREHLRKHLEIAGHDNVYYMDTDSYIVNQQGKNNLEPYIHHTELGMLDIELQAGKIIVHGNKDYIFGYHVKHKGISKKARLMKRNLWRQLQFEGWNTWLKGQGTIGARAKQVTRSRKTQYDKGNVNPKTGQVSPLRFVLYD